MNFDFPTLLVAATFFTGAAWAADTLVLAPRRARKARRQLERQGLSPESREVAAVLKEPTWIEYCKSFFPVILAVLLLRSFLVEPVFEFPRLDDADPAGGRLHPRQQVRLRHPPAGAQSQDLRYR